MGSTSPIIILERHRERTHRGTPVNGGSTEGQQIWHQLSSTSLPQLEEALMLNSSHRDFVMENITKFPGTAVIWTGLGCWAEGAVGSGSRKAARTRAALQLNVGEKKAWEISGKIFFYLLNSLQRSLVSASIATWHQQHCTVIINREGEVSSVVGLKRPCTKLLSNQWSSHSPCFI